MKRIDYKPYQTRSNHPFVGSLWKTKKRVKDVEVFRLSTHQTTLLVPPILWRCACRSRCLLCLEIKTKLCPTAMEQRKLLYRSSSVPGTVSLCWKKNTSMIDNMKKKLSVQYNWGVSRTKGSSHRHPDAAQSSRGKGPNFALRDNMFCWLLSQQSLRLYWSIMKSYPRLDLDWSPLWPQDSNPRSTWERRKPLHPLVKVRMCCFTLRAKWVCCTLKKPGDLLTCLAKIDLPKVLIICFTQLTLFRFSEVFQSLKDIQYPNQSTSNAFIHFMLSPWPAHTAFLGNNSLWDT